MSQPIKTFGIIGGDKRQLFLAESLLRDGCQVILAGFNRLREQGFENLDLREAISHLEEKDRNIIELRYFEDMDLNSISQVLNENLSTIKSRLYRALKKLKIELSVPLLLFI